MATIAPMLSTMMDEPLSIQQILWRIERLYPAKEVVTQRAEGEPRRATYGDVARRATQLASALSRFGIRPGDRVATFAWNTQPHLECYFAIPCMGAVLHTINVRLFDDQIEYIVNHAQDRVVFCDRSVLPVLERLAGRIGTVELFVLMNEGPEPSGALPNVIDYEAFLDSGDERFAWPALDERSAAAMCYTSGTTGNPKGVVYSHRSTLIHTLAEGLPNGLNISERDRVMYAVPMFHVNAWGMPYAAALNGASQVMCDRYLDPEHVFNLLASERVTLTAGVPTIWIGLLNLMQRSGRRLPDLRSIISGGSAVPASLIDGFAGMGIELVHAWGMTEMSPLGSVTRVKAHMEELAEKETLAVRAKQGIIAPTVLCRIVDLETGTDLPWDGVAFGELQVRGPWVTSTYFHDPDAAEKFMDGWLRTGDVATIDPEGYIQIVDRTKDVVKSGGEWISSVDLENTLMAHPSVLEAAVVGLPHPVWRHGRRVARVPCRACRQMVGAGRDRFRGRDSQDECREVRQDAPARPAQRRRRAVGRSSAGDGSGPVGLAFDLDAAAVAQFSRQASPAVTRRSRDRF
jgi:fatty-acyl-CoA synthase